jgi:hypothetical protein
VKHPADPDADLAVVGADIGRVDPATDLLAQLELICDDT